MTKIKDIPTSIIPIEKIIFDPKNPNQMSEAQMTALDKTMQKFGFAAEPWVNKRGKKYLIIDGEHRVKVLKQRGLKKIACKVFELKYPEVQILRQVANKLRGEHDPEMDLAEYKDILEKDNLGELADMLAEDEENFKKLIMNDLEPPETDEIPEPPKKPKSKLGVAYKLGRHTLHCMAAENLKVGDVDLLFTDPPYGINVVDNRNTIGSSRPEGFVNPGGRRSTPIKSRIYKKVIGDDKPFDPEFLLKYGKTQIIFGANHFSDKLPVNSHWLVWVKRTKDNVRSLSFSDAELMWTNIKKKTCFIYHHVWAGPFREGKQDVELKERVHPTQKPVGLLVEIITDYSKEGDTVLDPYLGSGSTLIACEKTNRTCIGSEIDPEYCDVIIQRWENFTGKKAEKIQSSGNRDVKRIVQK